MAEAAQTERRNSISPALASPTLIFYLGHSHDDRLGGSRNRRGRIAQGALADAGPIVLLGTGRESSSKPRHGLRASVRGGRLIPGHNINRGGRFQDMLVATRQGPQRESRQIDETAGQRRGPLSSIEAESVAPFLVEMEKGASGCRPPLAGQRAPTGFFRDEWQSRPKRSLGSLQPKLEQWPFRITSNCRAIRARKPRCRPAETERPVTPVIIDEDRQIRPNSIRT